MHNKKGACFVSENILILLGNRNDAEGNLSPIAESRADKAIDLLNADAGLKVIPTGAFGDIFNTSYRPQGAILTNYLIKKGIDESRILPFTHSSSTVEDAYEVLKLLTEITTINKVIVITSEFHMRRTKYIFSRVLERYNLDFCEVPNQIRDYSLTKQSNEESKKLIKLKAEWVDIARFNLDDCPDTYYENLGNEHRHYDSLSYYVVAGAFISFGFLMDTYIFDTSKNLKIVQCCIDFFLIIFLWLLYNRFAKTASSARRVMNSIELIFRKPGIHSTNTVTKVFCFTFTTKNIVDTLLLTMGLTFITKALLLYFGIIS